MTAEKLLDKIRSEPLQSDTLTELAQPFNNQLREQGELRDNDTLSDKQLKVAQQPVTSASNAVIKLRLRQEQYRAAWDYKDTYKADKWAHRDKVRQMRKERRELVQSRKAARKAEKAAKRGRKCEQSEIDPAQPSAEIHSRE